MQQTLRSLRLLLIIALSAVPAGAAPPAKPTPWYLKPVQRPEVPAGARQYVNPIDAFIAAKLKDSGLKAAGPADKATLLRRVYLDLIGIPPTPAEQEAFLADTAPAPMKRLSTGCWRTSSTACDMRGTGWMCFATPMWMTLWRPRPESITGVTGSLLR